MTIIVDPKPESAWASCGGGCGYSWDDGVVMKRSAISIFRKVAPSVTVIALLIALWWLVSI